MPTPDEVNATWSLIGKLGVILACIVGIIKAYQYLRSQTSVAKLEAKAKEHDQYLTNDKRHLKNIDGQISEINKRLDKAEIDRIKESEKISESLAMLGTSLSAMLNHMIDGNGIDKMMQERDALQKFFINK